MPPLPPQNLPQTTISVPAADNVTGHIMAMEQASHQWPGQSIRVVSEGLNGSTFEMTITHSPTSSAEPAQAGTSPMPENTSEADAPDGISKPKSVIFLTGDDNDFGEMPSPPSAGIPQIVATRGDSEDHRRISKKWAAALNGESLLWDGTLAWKYRTQTVVFRNSKTGHTIIEQGSLAADCGNTGNDVRLAVEQCLNPPDNTQ